MNAEALTSVSGTPAANMGTGWFSEGPSPIVAAFLTLGSDQLPRPRWTPHQRLRAAEVTMGTRLG
jgi:hypothetical protein